MALSATCIDRYIRFSQDEVHTTIIVDSILDVVVNNAGLLLASTITIRRMVGANEIVSYAFGGTGTECLGIEDELVTCIRNMGGTVGYADWSYP